MKITVDAQLSADQTALWVNRMRILKAVYDTDQKRPSCFGCVFANESPECDGLCCSKGERKDGMGITWRAV